MLTLTLSGMVNFYRPPYPACIDIKASGMRHSYSFQKTLKDGVNFQGLYIRHLELYPKSPILITEEIAVIAVLKILFNTVFGFLK